MQAEPSRVFYLASRVEPSWVEPSRTEQSQTVPHRTGPFCRRFTISSDFFKQARRGRRRNMRMRLRAEEEDEADGLRRVRRRIEWAEAEDDDGCIMLE